MVGQRIVSTADDATDFAHLDRYNRLPPLTVAATPCPILKVEHHAVWVETKPRQKAGVSSNVCRSAIRPCRSRLTPRSSTAQGKRIVNGPSTIIGHTRRHARRNPAEFATTRTRADRSRAPFTSKELASRTVYRRAVDAVIWGLPLVGEDIQRQAYFRDGKANYNDIVWWPKGGGWKNQSPTPNVNTRYMYFFINTKQDGPVVVELPPAVPGASFYGTIEDAWYVPLTDIGFEGQGGKYLVLPPDYKGNVPDGYTPVRPATYNTMTLLRSILSSDAEKDEQAGDELVKQVKVYPLSKAANSPA